jgi:hypothetical protein
VVPDYALWVATTDARGRVQLGYSADKGGPPCAVRIPNKEHPGQVRVVVASPAEKHRTEDWCAVIPSRWSKATDASADRGSARCEWHSVPVVR